MARYSSLAVLAAVAAGVAGGCKLPDKGAVTSPEVGPAAAAPEIGKVSLSGPDGAANAPPVELGAKDSARLCFAAATQMDASGEYAGAIPLYEKARQQEPAKYGKQAGRRLAVMYDFAGDFVRADAEYEAALKLAPTDPDLLNDYGYSLYSRGNWAAAADHLSRAVAAGPDKKRAWMNLGLALAQLGRDQESFDAFTKAVKPAEAHCNLAFVLAARGRTAEARTHYQRASELDPGLKLARAGMATIDNQKSDGPTTARGTPPTEPRIASVGADEQPMIAPDPTSVRPAGGQ